jgi:hypothetical protein
MPELRLNADIGVGSLFRGKNLTESRCPTAAKVENVPGSGEESLEKNADVVRRLYCAE